MKAFLILEDGTVFQGMGIGSAREVISEIVFNTSMTGYLEVLTDPSYAGQAVTMTYPLIGNYGICHEDMESVKAWPDGFIVRELARTPSNFRSDGSIDEFLKEQDIPGISGIDTRALTKLLREKGTMNGMITTNEQYDLDEVIPRIKEYRVQGVVAKVSCKEKIHMPNTGCKVALMDFGAKSNIANSLHKRGCDVTVYPAFTAADEILSSNPGHQLMALATGADTHKLKYGHRGANHPVKDLADGRVYISTQNHGYVVDDTTLNPDIAKAAFVNVNDGTNEGLEYVGKNIFTVQFHPEACAGPLDTAYLFDRFIKMMAK